MYLNLHCLVCFPRARSRWPIKVRHPKKKLKIENCIYIYIYLFNFHLWSRHLYIFFSGFPTNSPVISEVYLFSEPAPASLKEGDSIGVNNKLSERWGKGGIFLIFRYILIIFLIYIYIYIYFCKRLTLPLP